MATPTQPDFNKGLVPGPNGPCTHALAITPADNADLAMVARRLFIGTGGHVALIFRDDNAQPRVPVLLKNVPSGTLLDVWVDQVWATGTTAADIVALA